MKTLFTLSIKDINEKKLLILKDQFYSNFFLILRSCTNFLARSKKRDLQTMADIIKFDGELSLNPWDIVGKSLTIILQLLRTELAPHYVDQSVLEMIKPQLEKIEETVESLQYKDLKTAKDFFKSAMISYDVKFERRDKLSQDELKRYSDEIHNKLQDAQKKAVEAKNCDLKLSETLECYQMIITTELLEVTNELTRETETSQGWTETRIIDSWRTCVQYLQEVNELKELTDYLNENKKIGRNETEFAGHIIKLLSLNARTAQFFHQKMTTARKEERGIEAPTITGKKVHEIAMQFLLPKKKSKKDVNELQKMELVYIFLTIIEYEEAKKILARFHSQPEILSKLFERCTNDYQQIQESQVRLAKLTFSIFGRCRLVGSKMEKMLNGRQDFRLFEHAGVKELASSEGTIDVSSEKSGEEARNAFSQEGKWKSLSRSSSGNCCDFIEKELAESATPIIFAMKSAASNTAPKAFKVLGKEKQNEEGAEEEDKKEAPKWHTLLEKQNVTWDEDTWKFWCLTERKSVSILRLEISQIESDKEAACVSEIRLY